MDFEDSEIRQLLPGLAYTVPPKPARPDFLAASAASIVAAACQKDLPVAAALSRTVAGVGPVVCREAAWRAFGPEEQTACELDEAGKRRLLDAVEELKAEHAAGGCPCSVATPEGKPVEFTFFRPRQYGGGYEIRQWPSFCEMLEGYYAEKDRAERLRTKSKELHKAVHNMYERAVRKQAARREELAASEKSEQLRPVRRAALGQPLPGRKGDEEHHRPQLVRRGQGSDHPPGCALHPQPERPELLQELQEKSRPPPGCWWTCWPKGKRRSPIWRPSSMRWRAPPGEAALNEIRAELKGQGYLKYYKPRDKKQKPADFYRYLSSDGFEIHAALDCLTLHTARGRDLWFHTKNAPGSHTVVMSGGRDIPDRTREEAAQLAVLHSSQAKGVKVAVDYTEVKNIRKTAGLKPGMVLYDKYETAYITPDPTLAEKLKKK